MRAGKIHRVKRHLLRQAVAENLDTIRGLPPRAVRPLRRGARIWLQRAPLLIVSLALIGSTFLMHGGAPAATPPRVIPSAVRNPLPQGDISPTEPVLRSASDEGRLDMTLVPMSTSVFPLSVHRVVIDAGH